MLILKCSNKDKEFEWDEDITICPYCNQEIAETHHIVEEWIVRENNNEAPYHIPDFIETEYEPEIQPFNMRKEIPKIRTDWRLRKQNFRMGRIAAKATYIFFLLMPLAALPFKKPAIPYNSFFGNPTHIYFVVMGIAWLSSSAILIHHFSKYLENFTEDRKYKTYFKLFIISLSLFYLCVTLSIFFSDINLFMITFLISIPLFIYFLYSAVEIFKEYQHSEDYVGGLHNVWESMNPEKIKLFDITMIRPITQLLIPYYIYLTFKYAEEYTQANGFQSNMK